MTRFASSTVCCRWLPKQISPTKSASIWDTIDECTLESVAMVDHAKFRRPMFLSTSHSTHLTRNIAYRSTYSKCRRHSSGSTISTITRQCRWVRGTTCSSHKCGCVVSTLAGGHVVGRVHASHLTEHEKPSGKTKWARSWSLQKWWSQIQHQLRIRPLPFLKRKCLLVRHRAYEGKGRFWCCTSL